MTANLLHKFMSTRNRDDRQNLALEQKRMLAMHAFCLTFVIVMQPAVRPVSRAAVNDIVWNVTDMYPTHPSKSCYMLNRTHWACANDVDLLNDVSPEDSY